MTRTAFILFLFFFSVSVFGQVDYNQFKSKVPLTCTRVDSASVVYSQHILDSLWQYDIVKGREAFLHDIGMTYYCRYGIWKDTNDLNTSIKYAEIGFKESEWSSFAWSLAFNYSLIRDCSKAFEYVDFYIERRKKENLPIDYEQIYYVSKRCWKKE